MDSEVRPSAIAWHRAAAELAAPTDERDPTERLRAVDWARRAADEAMHRLAWEEAARLRRLALDLGGAAIDDDARCGLLLGLAQALQRCGDLATSLATCSKAAQLARDMDRPDLLADAALVLQGGDPALSRKLQRLAEEALAAHPNGPATTRSRLLAQVAEARLYQHDEAGADTLSRDSVAEAEAGGDRDTLLMALRARRLATLSPYRTDETLQLADRVLDHAPGAGHARHAFWAHVWRIQVWMVRGRLDLMTSELEPLADRVDELREPLATAQLQRFRAILASTRGQFADALEIAERGQSEFLRTGQAIAAAQHAGLRPAVMVREKSPCRGGRRDW